MRFDGEGRRVGLKGESGGRRVDGKKSGNISDGI